MRNIRFQFAEMNDEQSRAGHIFPVNETDTFKIKRNQGEATVATYEVDIIRIAEYINTVVGTRQIPLGKKGSVVMKLDVEV